MSVLETGIFNLKCQYCIDGYEQVLIICLLVCRYVMFLSFEFFYVVGGSHAERAVPLRCYCL